MKQKDSKILNQRKANLAKRLERKQYPEQPRPLLRAQNIHYEMAERVRAIDCGGIGAFHLLACNTGLVDAINENVHLLKRYLPYHESDHVLNIAYNTLTGGTCLDDIELRRNDETFMDGLGVERIPDPTTAGDFTRRFCEEDVVELMEAINSKRPKLWKKRLNNAERKEALVDVDGTHALTLGECKEGIGLSYDGKWCYHPLLVSLANTMEPLYLVNRSGNSVSHDGAVEWIDRAIGLVRQSFKKVCLRGDTDFALTVHFDRWSKEGVRFAFGIDAMRNLVEIAEGLESKRWRRLRRREKEPLSGERRKRPKNFKEEIVVEKGYRNIRLVREHVSEFSYQPTKCKRPYRVIVLKKSLSVEEGQVRLFDDVRYFFYITNRSDLTAAEVVWLCNERCNQENLIEQLKNGVNALRMPVDSLVANWSYMVMASLAWTLKAWFALLVRKREHRDHLLGMEFRRFLHGLIRIPVQIICAGHRIRYRILGYNQWVYTFMETFDLVRRLRLV
ncbi:MAG: IS1380 family transposase [Deltaproteobacteria bacterium]|nr:IS1380 family transposase [Deltaproteobacteria bacterium]